MKVTRVPLGRFRDLTKRVSEEKYHSNVIAQTDAHALTATRFRALLEVKSSYGPGARTSRSGDHDPTPPARCRDVLTAG